MFAKIFTYSLYACVNHPLAFLRVSLEQCFGTSSIMFWARVCDVLGEGSLSLPLTLLGGDVPKYFRSPDVMVNETQIL